MDIYNGEPVLLQIFYLTCKKTVAMKLINIPIDILYQ